LPVGDFVGALGHAGDDLLAVGPGGRGELADVLVDGAARYHATVPVEDPLIGALLSLHFVDAVFHRDGVVAAFGGGGRGVGALLGGLGCGGGVVCSGDGVAVSASTAVPDFDRLPAGG
jgi:hypothetical protein